MEVRGIKLLVITVILILSLAVLAPLLYSFLFIASGNTVFFQCDFVNRTDLLQRQYENNTYPIRNVSDFNPEQQKIINQALEYGSNATLGVPPESVKINDTTFNSSEEPFYIEGPNRSYMCGEWLPPSA